jgi:hypothetical protein
MIPTKNVILLLFNPSRNATEDMHLTNKIRSFSTLKRGWHYGRGGPIDKECVQRALRIQALLLYLGLTELDAFPGADSEILLTCYSSNNYVEILLEANGAISITHEKDGKILTDLTDVHEPASILSKIAGEIWRQSGSFTCNTTIKDERDLIGWRSITHQMVLVPQLSRWIASEKDKLLSVNISENFIAAQRATLPYSGHLTQKPYQ